MAVPSYGLIVDPKYIYFSESAQRALQHIKNCASDLWERPHHHYIGLRSHVHVRGVVPIGTSRFEPRLGACAQCRSGGLPAMAASPALTGHDGLATAAVT